MCNLVRYEVINDQELLKLHKDRIGEDCYFDKNSHILTQDLIYAVTRHLSIEESPQKSKITVHETDVANIEDLQVEEQIPNLNPGFVNHTENANENKKLGDLGEHWALEYERKRLVEAGKEKLADDIVHISSEKGDGAGYDIESFNEDGSKRFIEVKTTRGKFNQPFYITRNELEKSIIEKDHYSIYRIYHFNESDNSAQIRIINGDLTSWCNFPTLYRVKLMNDN